MVRTYAPLEAKQVAGLAIVLPQFAKRKQSTSLLRTKRMASVYDTSIEDHKEPLLPSQDEEGAGSSPKSKMVKKLSLLLGALVGLLVHLSTLGINVWLSSAGFPLQEHRLSWSVATSLAISTLVVLVFLVLSALSDELQSVQLISLALETCFVAGFLCSLVFASTCYDSMVMLYFSGARTMYSINAASLVILLLGWLSVQLYEKTRLEEIAQEEAADKI